MTPSLCRKTGDMQNMSTQTAFLEMDRKCHPERYSIPDKTFAETLPEQPEMPLPKIVESFKNCRCKSFQIQILADLNNVTPKTIKLILKNYGALPENAG